MSAITEDDANTMDPEGVVRDLNQIDWSLVSVLREFMIDRYSVLSGNGYGFGRDNTIPEMRQDLTRLWECCHQSEDNTVIDVLPGHLCMIPVAEEAQDWQYSAEVYQLTSAIMCLIEELELAFLAADRAIGASKQGGDVLGMAAGYYRLCDALLAKGKKDGVLETVRLAKILMERSSIEDPARVSLRGALELCRAIASARYGQADDAFASIREAYEIAKVVPAGANSYHTEFGHANVAVYEVAVFVELGMYDAALVAAANVDQTVLSYTRRARLYEYVRKARSQMAATA